jgi:hypothetical protein
MVQKTSHWQTLILLALAWLFLAPITHSQSCGTTGLPSALTVPVSNLPAPQSVPATNLPAAQATLSNSSGSCNLTWVSGTDLPTGLYIHTLNTLNDGRVVLLEQTIANNMLGTISGNTVTWVTTTATPGRRQQFTTSKLSDGRLLVTGGRTGAAQSTTWIGTVSSNSITWVTSTALLSARSSHAATVLSTGRILVVGGGNSASDSVSTTYLGTVSSNSITWVTSTALPADRQDQGLTLLQDGRVLVVGGTDDTLESYDNTWLGTISSNSITWVASTVLPGKRQGHTLNTLSDGRVIVLGGYETDPSFNITDNTWIGTISGNTITWVSSTAMPSGRDSHATTILNDNRVMTTGGRDTNSDVANNTWLGTLN